MLIYILGCFVHRQLLRIIKMNASFRMFGPDQISGKSSKCLITKFPKGFIKIVPSINIWIWVFSPLWWQEEKEERKEGKEKITFCSIRILFPSHHSNFCQQSTCDLNVAKSSGHSQSSAHFTFIIWHHHHSHLKILSSSRHHPVLVFLLHHWSFLLGLFV